MTSLLPAAVDPSGGIRPEDWSHHTMWWSERSRSRALLWPAGEDWFSNDPLGMTGHTHPDSSEVFLVASGTMELTVGREPVVLGPGDFCLVPPGTYHLPVNVGDDDLCVWVVVAPNWRGCRWKPQDFVESDFAGSTEAISTRQPGPLPSDGLLRSEVVALGPGEGTGPTELRATERAVYVLEGSADVTIERLSGPIGTHEFVNVMAGASHSLVGGPDGARFLSVECYDPPSAAGDFDGASH